MFNRGTKTAATTESSYQEEWHISVVEILELDPWKYFKTPVLAYSKVRA
ncbi:MAG: hypothetical protein QNJ42_15885 [Crocosphaera sp.]|nr:hypothetical protein [Crocosphaera sp.]